MRGRQLRTMLTVATALVALALVVFAFLIVGSQSRARRDAERRFQDRAQISASLSRAVLTFSGNQAQSDGAKRFAGRVRRSEVARLARDGHAAYLEIVETDGKLLAASGSAPSTPPAKRSWVQAALRGHAMLSDVLPTAGGSGGVVEWALPIRVSGGWRAEVVGSPVAQLGAFLETFLAPLPNLATADAMVIDSNGRLIGGGGAHVRPGQRLDDPALLAALRRRRGGDYGQGLHFASATLAGSPWTGVLRAPRARVYRDVGGTRRVVTWLIFAAFAIAAGLGLALLRRVAGTTAELERRLLNQRTAVEINDNIIQRLVLAKYALDAGDSGTGRDRVGETLGEAQRLVSSLLEDKPIEPGDLQRSAPADVPSRKR